MLYNEALNIHIEYLNSTFYPPSSFLRAALKFSLLQFLFINYSIRFETLEFPKKKNASRRATSFFPILLTSFLKQDFQEFSPSTFETKKKKTKEKDNTKIKISSISSLENVLHFTKRKISPVEKRTIEKKRGKKKENVGSSNFWGELEAVWAMRRLAMAERRAEDSLPPLPARSFRRADRPRGWVGSWVRHSPRWAGRRISATFDRTPASRGISAIAGIHLDIASNDCTICPGERSHSRRRCTGLSNEIKRL